MLKKIMVFSNIQNLKNIKTELIQILILSQLKLLSCKYFSKLF